MELWNGFFRNVRYAARMLARTPGFTAVAVLSLALGIGANVAIFTLVDRVLLRLLPVENPSSLVVLAGSVSYPRYEFFRDQGGKAFAGVLGFAGVSRVSIEGSEDEGSFLEGRLVSGTYFDILGVKPLLGRLITPDDDRVPGGHPIAVLSHSFWQRYFNGDPSVLGRAVRLSPGSLSTGAGTSGFDQNTTPAAAVPGGRFTIVGVAWPGFYGETVGQHPDFFTPLMMQEHFMPGRPWLRRKTASWIRVMARLKPGLTRQQVQPAANMLLQRAMLEDAGSPSENERREIAQRTLLLVDGDKGLSGLRSQASTPLWILTVMVGVVLLIACANLANLLLARASARRREIGVRLAIGAGRARVVRQLLTESIVIAFLGGAAAIAVAWWGSHFIFAMVAEGNSASRLNVTPDARTFVFTSLVALSTALLFGVGPALRGTRVDLNSTLKEGGRGLGGGHWRTGRVLVAAQVALSVLLLIGTGLFTRTLYGLKTLDLGYGRDNIILMRVDPVSGHKGDDIGRVSMDLLAKIRALPGVHSATFSENGLFSGTESGGPVRIDGFTPASRADRNVRFDQVGPGYFTNVGIPLLAGRDLTEADNPAGPPVVVINESMARFYFGAQNPVGRLVHLEFLGKQALTIVGVARDARDHSLRDQVHRRMYVSFLQPIDGLTTANYEVRTNLDSAVMARQLRAAVRDVDRNMPILSIKPLTTLIDENLRQERIVAKLSILFGSLAAILASIGLYGILAYSVVRRTNEIGIRIALGGSRRAVVWMVLRETFVLVIAGVAIGVPVAIALSRYIATLLFGLKPNDVATIAAVILLMCGIALCAAIAPARRAAGIDPLVALRYE
jgi:predicted permease